MLLIPVNTRSMDIGDTKEDNVGIKARWFRLAWICIIRNGRKTTLCVHWEEAYSEGGLDAQ